MKVQNALLITAAVLFPFGWVVYRLIRYTAKSMGDESPLAVKVVYQVTQREYFTRFNFLYLIPYALFNVFMLYATVFLATHEATAYWHWLIALSGAVVAVIGLWWVAQLVKLEWQYWQITKGKTVTLDPADKSLEIATFEDTVRFTAADLQEIEIHAPGPVSSKLVGGYHYFIFKLNDGQRVFLNHNKSYLDYSLEEYFKTVPFRYVPHKIPWIVAA